MARMLYSVIRGAVADGRRNRHRLRVRLPNGRRIMSTVRLSSLLTLTLTLALSLGADALGAQISRSEASSQLLMVPQLLLIVLSTGMAPADSFPDWLHPFVQLPACFAGDGNLAGVRGPAMS